MELVSQPGRPAVRTRGPAAPGRGRRQRRVALAAATLRRSAVRGAPAVRPTSSAKPPAARTAASISPFVTPGPRHRIGFIPTLIGIARSRHLCQDPDVSRVDVDTSIGYALKRAATALRTALEASLHSFGLSVPQYSCLEILDARPGISNADLARGVFVTRQAMHQLLGGLQAAGLVVAGGQERVQRYSLTLEGQRIITVASAAVAAVEQQMLSGLRPAERQRLHGDLERCTAALQDDS